MNDSSPPPAWLDRPFYRQVVVAAFIASSWTWCIGMYLPVELRDMYGWAAIIALAVPNLLGLALLPWFIAGSAASRAFAVAHRPMILLFSLVTITFHAYFLTFIADAEFGRPAAVGIGASIVLMFAAWAASGWSDRQLMVVGLCALVLSWVMLITTAIGPQLGWSGLQGPRVPHWPQRDHSIAFLAPFIAFGFLVCPWLDLTLHRAARFVDNPAAGRRAFLFGSILFASMLGFTALYAVRGFSWPVAVHLAVQSWFTVTAHWRAIRATDESGPPMGSGIILLAAAVGIAAALIPGLEYHHWFGFYGLLFPLYLVGTFGRRRLGRRKLDWPTLAILFILCGPFALVGFIDGYEVLTLVPVTVMIACLFAGRRTATHPRLTSTSALGSGA